VSSFDEQDLGQRVDRALATITAGPAPAAAIMAQGRWIRRRRRVVRTGAVAVLAALTLIFPALLYKAVQGGQPPGPAAQGLTVNRLGPIARNGVIGSGTLDGKPWTVRLAGTRDPVAQAKGLPPTGRLGTRPGGSAPVTLHVAGSVAQRLLAGPVSPGVAYLTIRLADGSVHRLYPVAWHGHSYIGLVLPWNLAMARLTAYSRHGELAYAIPFSEPDHFPQVVSWLRPGAPVPAEISATVATGWNAGTQDQWSIVVRIGPWGTCLLNQAGYSGIWCRPTLSYPANAVIRVTSGPDLTDVAGITGRAVAYIKLTLRNGKTTRLHVLHVGGQGFYALSVVTNHVASWTAYTTAGRAIASGTGPPG